MNEQEEKKLIKKLRIIVIVAVILFVASLIIVDKIGFGWAGVVFAGSAVLAVFAKKTHLKIEQ